MASAGLIKFYKGYILVELSKKITYATSDEICIWLKTKFNIQEKSCVDMTNDELYEIIYFCFELGDTLGLSLNFKGNENDFIREL